MPLNMSVILLVVMMMMTSIFLLKFAHDFRKIQTFVPTIWVYIYIYIYIIGNKLKGHISVTNDTDIYSMFLRFKKVFAILPEFFSFPHLSGKNLGKTVLVRAYFT